MQRITRTTRVAAILLCAVAGCPMAGDDVTEINPFRDLPAVAIDGGSHDLTATVTPIGQVDAGDVIRVFVEGTAVESVLILAEDGAFEEAGTVVGGGPANEAFDYRIPAAGRYFVFAEFAADATGAALLGKITLSAGDVSFEPPATQRVVISFDASYLSAPGLFDPDSGSDEERAFLEQISDQVRDGIVARVRSIFDGTPIEVFEERDGLPAVPFSRVTLSPERVVARDDDFTLDSTIPLGAGDSECQDRVIFGEVLPAGAPLDTGNRISDDEAVVYVGSFQGRGLPCRTAAINSVNNITLGLSQTVAHEIGHLVGLRHVALVDIMDRSPSQAFQRELTLARGQVLTETRLQDADGTTSVATTVLTTVVQDPDVYFRSVFSAD